MSDYHIEVIDPRETKQPSCYDCGEPADIILVADEPEKETGYVEEIELCNDCYYKRLEKR